MSSGGEPVLPAGAVLTAAPVPPARPGTPAGPVLTAAPGTPAVPASVEATPVVRVVAAALYDSQGRVLIAERPPGKHLSGRWEFPGGKIEPGETRLQALARELREELGVEIASAREVITLRHDYPQKSVEVFMYIVEDFAGTPRGLDGQSLKWVAPALLPAEDVLEADRLFVEMLAHPERLPRNELLTL